MNLIVILYVIFFTFWLLIMRNKSGASKYLLSIYLASSVCGLILFCFYYNTIEYPDRVTVESVSFHLLLLFLLLFPIINFSKNFYGERISITEKSLTTYSWLIIIPSIFAIILSSIDILKILLFHDFLLARNAFLAGDISNLYTTNYGIIGYLPSFGPQISFLALFFFFYRYFRLNKHDLTSLLLFISSFAIVLNNLAIAGREGFVRWFFYLGFCWALFHKNIPFRQYKNIYIIGLTSLFIAGAFFFAITTDRFEESDEGTLHSLFLYAGEPTYNFSYIYQRFYDKGISNAAAMFPLVSGTEKINYGVDSLVAADFRLNTFATICGSFLLNTGGRGCFIITVIWFILMMIILRNREQSLNLSLIVTYLFAYEIVMLGVLYYLHGNRFTQLSIVAYIILALIVERGIKRS